MTIKVIHQRSKCIGCGSCVLEDPQLWAIDEKDGLATLKNSVQKGDFSVGIIDKSDLEAMLKVEACCPVGSIKVIR